VSLVDVYLETYVCVCVCVCVCDCVCVLRACVSDVDMRLKARESVRESGGSSSETMRVSERVTLVHASVNKM
jgi:hypothetical protein